MKSGTLVMLVRHINGACASAPKVGAIGEYCYDLFVDGVTFKQCYFPGYPTEQGNLWSCYPQEIIPISNPDLDVGVCDVVDCNPELIN